LAVLGLQLKIYTEQLKDRKFDFRSEKHSHDGGVKTRPEAGARREGIYTEEQQQVDEMRARREGEDAD
jgi:hypothetical protein